MHLASPQIKVHIVIRQNPGKPLGNPAHLKRLKGDFFVDNRTVLLHANSFSGQALLPDPFLLV
jgi:hypothetical protein